ncbi:E3 ubiquitin-protein ligase Topors-like, partial [Polyodon spathula]|uniref:E3 ubiquitin-protein ligase Topors-like n=1 Tax=Polyodon spathula TaxID=7913 RepID=UPI001B7EFC05
KSIPKGGSSKFSQTVSAEASPDSKCPICLDRFNNVAYLDRCLHKFCYRCIHEWWKNKAECPLCRQPFDSVYRTTEAENDFKELVLRPTENGSFGSHDRHRYRTIMSRRTSPPPDNGILFEGLTGNAPPQRDRGVQRMKLQLAARRRAQTEFISFARAPYNMGAYDQHPVYDCAAVSYEEWSSSEFSVISISTDEADIEEDQGTHSMAGSGLSQASWDDETPGPSCSAMEQVQPAMFSVHESESVTSGDEEGQIRPSVQESAQVKTDPSANEGADASSTDEDCVIVGFVKPLAERTPELVQLSSDSEESVHNESTEVPAQPQHLRFPSISSPPSSVCSVVSKDKSPHGHKTSNKKEASKDRDQSNLPDKARHSPTHRPSNRDKNSRGTDTSNICSKGMHAHDDRRHHRRDRLRSKERSRQKNKSTENSWPIKSTTTSLNSDSTLSRGRQQSRSCSRDYPPSRDMGWQRSRHNNNSYVRHSHEKSYSYHLDSYSHYSRDRGIHCTFKSGPIVKVTIRSSSISSSSSRASLSARWRSRCDKPSRKRKYKTRHLEGTSKEVTTKSYTSRSCSLLEKSGSSEWHHKKSRKKSRSLSVEIVYDGKATGESRRCNKKHKRKKKCKRHRSREKAGHRSLLTVPVIMQ